jgi:predicted GNAT family acetyltransferase
MEIVNHKEENGGCFSASIDGREAGKLSYSTGPDGRIVIEHTVVRPEFKGKNAGKELVYAAIDFARSEKAKVVPVCRFAKMIFDRNPELQEML